MGGYEEYGQRSEDEEMNRCLLSNNKDNWGTPQVFFDELDKEFHFTLDPCADEFNHKCKKYFTKEQNGLIQSWEGEIVFCNPPYGREIGKWVHKSLSEVESNNCTCVVMLIPARTDTQWFHRYIYDNAEIRFIKGRLKFTDENGECDNAAPFPSMVVIFRK